MSTSYLTLLRWVGLGTEAQGMMDMAVEKQMSYLATLLPHVQDKMAQEEGRIYQAKLTLTDPDASSLDQQEATLILDESTSILDACRQLIRVFSGPQSYVF